MRDPSWPLDLFSGAAAGGSKQAQGLASILKDRSRLTMAFVGSLFHFVVADFKTLTGEAETLVCLVGDATDWATQI